MKKWLNKRLIDGAAVLLGISLAFAFAPFAIFPLAIIAPAGLLALILLATPRRAGTIGFAFGLGLFSAGIYWVFISIHDFGDVPNFLAAIITAGLIVILALFPAYTCYLTNRYYPSNNAGKLIFAYPALWIIIDWIRSWVGCGFPWLFIGYSQTTSPLRGFAPFLSVYGTSLAALVTSGLIVYAGLALKQKNLRAILQSFLTIISIWTVGAFLSLIAWTHPAGKPITVSLVQGNIPQSIKWSPEFNSLSFKRYADLTAPLWQKSDLIVWPEAAIPLSLQNAADFIQKMDEKALANHSHLILGIPIQNPKGEGYYNAVVTLGANKTTYLKRRLVPYGEYVPFQQLSSHVLNFMQVPMSNMIAGSANQPPLIAGNTKINASICFEIAFPELINMHDKTIGLLLTVTNDAWFGHSSAQAQHLQMAEMRAIELGRPVLFASNDGITAIITPQGTLASQAPPYVPYVLTSTVQPMVGLTPWMTNGIDPLLIILFIFLLGAKRSSRLSRPIMSPLAPEAPLIPKN